MAYMHSMSFEVHKTKVPLGSRHCSPYLDSPPNHLPAPVGTMG